MENNQRDFLWMHIRSLPYFRSLLRAVEARTYQEIALPSPTLDLGCGDGHFASVTFERQVEVGLDPWGKAVREAAVWGGYQALVQASGAEIPFPEGHFASAISNSVLEHIPELDAVLSETYRVLKPNAPFIFCVPNDRLVEELSIAKFFDRIHLARIGSLYRDFFNSIARHYHSDPPAVWQKRLSRAGFKIERWWHYFSPKATAVMEWGHYLGVPSLFCRWLTGRWILVPARWNLALTYRLIEPYYAQDAKDDLGTYTFYITTRNP